jgi:hypothetical protein
MTSGGTGTVTGWPVFAVRTNTFPSETWLFDSRIVSPILSPVYRIVRTNALMRAWLPPYLPHASRIRFISSREKGSVGFCVTFGGFTESAGLCLIHPACWQKRKKARNRSRFLDA